MPQLFFLVALLVASGVRAQSVADCPAGADAGVDVVILDGSVPVTGATVLFTASDWDSTLSQLSDELGKVSVLCVPPGEGYEVTVLKRGYAVARATTAARRDRPTMSLVLSRLAGRYVRVMHRGSDLPGVTVTVTDSDGTAQTLITDESGVAEFAQLRAPGDATIEITLPGFTPQRARIHYEYKNRPVVFDMPIETVCTPIAVHSGRDSV